jgi:uncharacterized protein (TIGR02996 family)
LLPRNHRANPALNAIFGRMADALAGRLEQVKSALDAGDQVAALERLLDAWRDARHPRIADLIDAVSARIETQPIGAQSAKALNEKWLAGAKKASPAELGALLATPWPPKWQLALPRVEALLAHDDPRVAMALARLFESAPWDSHTSDALYRPLLSQLAKLGDLRVLPTLERERERVRSKHWRETTLPAAKRAESALKKQEVPALTAREAKLVEELEKRLPSTQRKSDEELLAAIYAAPHDDAPRAVYADVLAERGDPRGEFIALQLAHANGRATPESRRRERALLTKYEKQWLGRFERFVKRPMCEFRRGFLARAVIDIEHKDGPLDRDLADPAWSTIETLGLGVWASDRAREILALPAFRHVRALRGVDERVLVELAPWPHIVELDLSAPWDWPIEEHARLFDAFPALEHLATGIRDEALAAWLAAPVGRRLRRLTRIDAKCPLAPFRAFVEARDLPNLVELGMVSSSRDYGEEWRFTLRRDERGCFTRLFAEGGAYALARALDGLTELTEIVADPTQPTSDDLHAGLASLAESLERFPEARVDVPWKLPNREQVLDAAAFRLRFFGAVDRAKLLNIVAAPPIAMHFDTYEVDAGKAATLAKKSPLDVVNARLTKGFEVRLFAKDVADARLIFDRHSAIVELRRSAAEASALVDWALATAPHIGVTRVWADLTDDVHHKRRVQPFDTPLLWLMPVDASKDAFISFDELIARAGKGPFAWLQARRCADALVLVLGERPDRPLTDAQIDALEALFFELLWESWKRRLGFDPHAWLVEQVTPIFARYGFSPAGDLAFVARPKSGACCVRLKLAKFFTDSLEFYVSTTQLVGDVDGDPLHPAAGAQRKNGGLSGAFPMTDRATAAASIARLAERLPTECFALLSM